MYFGDKLIKNMLNDMLCKAADRRPSLQAINFQKITPFIFLLAKFVLLQEVSKTHALYIPARNHTKFILQLTKNSFINRNCQSLSNSNASCDFWYLANNISNNFTSSSFPPLLQPTKCFHCSISMELLST